LPLSARDFALKAARLLSEKKAVDINLLEMSKVSLVADYFLICSGTSGIQTRALCEHLQDKLPEPEYPLLRVEGYQEARWILLDFGSLVIHIFLPEERSFYNLERLWGGAEEIELNYSTIISG